MEDAGEIVALATTDQIVAAFDEDLFTSENPGEREVFDVGRFIIWLEVILEAGDDVTANRVAELSDAFVWRYDPIIITPVTGYDFHAATFERLARSLRGMTRRSVISIVDLYRKTDRRMAALANDGFAIDGDAANNPEMLELLSHIARIAQAEEMVPLSCAEEADYSKLGINAGSCIDGELIQSLGGHAPSKKDPGQRSNCRCVVSREHDGRKTRSLLHGLIVALFDKVLCSQNL